MSDIVELLRQYLPLEIALLAVAILAMMRQWKANIEKSVSLADKRADSAKEQAEYLRDRLDSVDKLIATSSTAFELEQKKVRTLEAEIQRQNAERDEVEASLRGLSEQTRELRVGVEEMGAESRLLSKNLLELEQVQADYRRLAESLIENVNRPDEKEPGGADGPVESATHTEGE